MASKAQNARDKMARVTINLNLKIICFNKYSKICYFYLGWKLS
jgi:hypothetical protein